MKILRLDGLIPYICLGQKLQFPPRYDCFGKKKRGRTCVAAEADQAAHPEESQGVLTATPCLPVPAAAASAAA